jgi:hypothetical protein
MPTKELIKPTISDDTIEKTANFIKQRCKEIKLPKRRWRKEELLRIGYILGMADTVKIHSTRGGHK